ncbi:MAG: helix-turn-helix transcriptional regulator [Proteobacteria bacterium]|nr:helix-turn-helix transcriptional regulator [Pseudomonadota bacterium]
MSNYNPTAFSTQVVARLRGLIAQYDVNQADLAQLCDVSQSQFSKIIRGVRPMTLDQFVAICDALGVSAQELVEQALSYTETRHLSASPLVFVEHGDRLSKPRELEFEEFDSWAQGAYGRLDVAWGRRPDVPASQDDVALAAYDDPDWQERQERDQEFP